MMDKFQLLQELLIADRSVRRFDASFPIDRKILEDLVSLVRYCASGRNLQPLRYRLVTEPAQKEKLFKTLAWAGYYKDWAGPEPEERPSAYLVQCLDSNLASDCLCDDGLQLQAITLGATTLGLSCCIVKSFDIPKAVAALHIPERFRPRYVLAIGKAAEKTEIVDLPSDGDFKYYRDENDTQCVPKRSLDELIVPSE